MSKEEKRKFNEVLNPDIYAIPFYDEGAWETIADIFIKSRLDRVFGANAYRYDEETGQYTQ